MLGIYESPLLSAIPVSSDGTYSNPSSWQFALGGGSVEKRVSLKTDSEELEYFTNVVITAQDSNTPDNSAWFSFAPDNNGVPGSYVSVLEVGNVLLHQAVPIWIKSTVPTQPTTGTKTNIKIVVSYILYSEE